MQVCVVNVYGAKGVKFSTCKSTSVSAFPVLKFVFCATDVAQNTNFNTEREHLELVDSCCVRMPSGAWWVAGVLEPAD